MALAKTVDEWFQLSRDHAQQTGHLAIISAYDFYSRLVRHRCTLCTFAAEIAHSNIENDSSDLGSYIYQRTSTIEGRKSVAEALQTTLRHRPDVWDIIARQLFLEDD